MKPFAALVACAVFAAGGASAQTYRIDVRDLDLSSPSGLSTLDHRVEARARQACRSAHRTGSRIPDTAFCLQAFRAEVERQLPPSSRYEYARVRSGQTAL